MPINKPIEIRLAEAAETRVTPRRTLFLRKKKAPRGQLEREMLWKPINKCIEVYRGTKRMPAFWWTR